MLKVAGSYIIEDHQVWGSVLVHPGGRLIVANGGHLETGYIHLNPRSVMEVRSGQLTMEAHSHTDVVGIFGECDRFIISHQSVVRIRAPDGSYEVAASRGADAGIDVVAEYVVRIENSIVNISAGFGMSPPEPLTFGDLTGEAFAGGDAFVHLRVRSVNVMTNLMSLKNSNIILTGGDGGDAPDGRSPPSPNIGGPGGGLTRGGDVSDEVATGGDASMSLDSRFIDVKNTFFDLDGGHGGDGGDGGDALPGDRAGAGGGGYSGGDGAHADLFIPALPGGSVSGHVGSGGDTLFSATGEAFNITTSGIILDAGNGGDAGDGGASHDKGGGGGGGYTGGGGGAHGLFDGGDGGTVAGSIGRGGDAVINLTTEGWLMLDTSGAIVYAGDGGDAGDGGNVTFTGGGGGGGASGGGGGAQGPDDGSFDGTDGGLGGQVGGRTQSGGRASIDLGAYSVICLDSSVKAKGGFGGEEGEAGAYSGSVEMDALGGAGGGGRSGGGGAGKGVGPSSHGRPGAGGTVTERVGTGGLSRSIILSDYPTISSSTDVVSRPGPGGEPLDHIPSYPLEGYSVSGHGGDGLMDIHIPMSATILQVPKHEASIFKIPVFRWIDVHSSTVHGNVTGYVVVVDDDPEFESPDRLVEVHTNSASFKGFSFSVHYWYVRAVYENDTKNFGPSSKVSWFSFYNAPPRFYIIEPLRVFERQATTVDMSRYISDPDTEAENLTLTSADERVLEIEGLDMILYFEDPSSMEWIRFSVTDGFTTKWFNLPVTVADVNDPPVIVRIGDHEPPVTIEITEGEIRWFEVVAEDRDNEELKLTLLSSWQDIRLDSGDRIRIWARPGLLGDRTAKLLVEDERHAITSTKIIIRVINRPDPPELIEVFGPKDHSTHLQLDPITFTVKVTDPDTVWGEEVTVSWESDVSGPLMTRTTGDVASFTTNDLPLGPHTITITIDDGEHVEVTTVQINVVERPPPPGSREPVEEGIPPLAIALLVIMPLLGYYLGRKGVGYARD